MSAYAYQYLGHLLENGLFQGVPMYVVSEHDSEVPLYLLSPVNVSFFRASLIRNCRELRCRYSPIWYRYII